MRMRKDTGFTLLELMVVIAIMATIAAIGTPLFLQYRSNAKLKGAAGNLRSDLELAKLSAIRENASVAATLTLTGYTIFVDNGAGANANNWIFDADEHRLRNIQLPPGITLTTDEANDRVRFDSRGVSSANIIITFADTSGRQMLVTVSLVGRIRIPPPP